MKLHDSIPVTVEQAIARARALTELPIRYVLGAGGRDPKVTDPQSEVRRGGRTFRGLDCSGAACYILGFDRYQPEFEPRGGWVNTDGIIEDARGGRQLFEPVDYPEPGCLVVFPGVDLDRDGKRDRIGHVAFVVEPPAEWDPSTPQFELLRIIDCAPSNARISWSKGAVAEHRATYFAGKHRFRGLERERWGSMLVRFRGYA